MSDSEAQGKNFDGSPEQLERHGGRVFYVDDDAVVRSSVARRLTRRGYLVREFDSGESILACFQTEQDRPDVILLDYHMPGMNGVETFHAIRDNMSDRIPVILFTAYPGALNVEETKRQGLLDVLTKNVELENIIGVIQVAMGSKMG